MIADPRRWYRLAAAALAGARAELDAIREAFEYAAAQLEEYRPPNPSDPLDPDHDHERTP